MLKVEDELLIYLIPGLSFILGIISCRLLFVWKLYNSSVEKKCQWFNYVFYAVLMPWKTDFIEKLVRNIKVSDRESLLDSWYPGKEQEDDKYLN